MERTAVSSSLLKSIFYSPDTRVLEIEFKAKKEGEAGKVYRYADVSPLTYEKFLAAPSLGSHFLKQIKPNHSCTRVEEKPDAESKDEIQASEARKPFRTATPDENTPF